MWITLDIARTVILGRKEDAAMTREMTAAVICDAGGPEVLRLERRPVPEPTDGEVLIRVRALGLNKSELFTRQGRSPNVAFPRILGIEAVGEVAAAPGGEFVTGDIVATAMVGMGRQFDGEWKITALAERSSC